MKKYNLFVYGTLKRGFPLDYYLKSAKFLEEMALTGYDMYDLGPFPGIKLSLDSSSFVLGERYEITEDLLPYLDALEGHPVLYKRTEMTADSDVLGTVHDFWVYVYNGGISSRQKIPDGLWKLKGTKTLS